jgi:hypothetical protein
VNSKINPTGKVIARVYDEKGSLLQESIHHNIITEEGDAYIADLLSPVSTRLKIDSSNCFIPVGTGWTGTNTKQNGWVNTQVGLSQVVDTAFPKVKGSWGAVDDNVVQFQVTYPAGTLNFSGINEAALTSHSTNIGDNTTLAYAQISPPVNVTATDVLIISWELSFLGA